MSRTITDVLSDYFHIGDSYHYVLGREKAAFGVGTMSVDDFKEFDEDEVAEIAAYLEVAGASIPHWISTAERMPEDFVSVIVHIPGDEPLPTVREAYHVDGAWVAHTGIYSDPHVPYWTPFPEPPTGVTNVETVPLPGWNLDERDIEIVRAYADANMNATEASRRLYMHRNSVDYHLDKVRKVTGLQPRMFSDLRRILDSIDRSEVKV